MTCEVSHEQISDFAQGGAPDLEEHVADCDRCQERLAALWEPPHEDFVAKTMRIVRLNAAGRDLMEMAIGLLGAFGTALTKYTLGGDE